ncbi:DUF3857 domain-containing protein [Olleya sp. HaHaR_3_96]|uniref:DUF3857 domain-containing protein n=1 Tax=Olleya sp. HaHaR_3_96 TaxID=2745560 RepID=UPI001C4F931A|nr:DUF3857 domain-containing protein [Olleya sp. HaHaR_3_96]QXP61216.1 DUF3857 domain-containing protein [Olleya sp. HaHaR_3_96]
MKKLTILTFMFMSVLGQSQNFKFGKVSKEELKQAVHPIEKEANAAVLYKEQEIFFEFIHDQGFVQKNVIFERIKIYNKEGLERASKVIRLYNESNLTEQTVTSLKAYTYNLENGKIVKEKLKSNGVFDEETNQYWKTKKFTMPNVNIGSVIEYRYIIESTFLQVDKINFQEEIPVNKLKFEFRAPEYFNYTKHLNLKAKFLPKVYESTSSREILMSYVKKPEPGSHREAHSKSRKVVSKQNVIENIMRVEEKNIPALKDEPFVDNLTNYRSGLKLEYAYYKGIDGNIESYATNWDRVTTTIYQSEDFGGQLNKNNYFEDDINKLVSSAKTNSEKINLIFNHVKSKVKVNGYVGYMSEKGVKQAYKEGSGNVADINLMLVEMLRHSGVNANPVLISTKDNGVPFFPTRSGFNYVICAVEGPDSILLLDASTLFTKPNIIPQHVINWQGRLIREDGSSTWIGLNPSMLSKDIVSASVKINQDLSMEGKLRKVLTAYQALNYRNSKAGLTNESLVQNIEKDHAGLIVSNLEVKNIKDIYKPIMQSYDFTLDGAVEDIGGNLYISPLLFLTNVENPFTQNTRNYPIDFIYPRSDKYIINMDIPEGYQLESLPESEAIKFNSDALAFSYLTKQIGDKIQIVVNLNINNTYILPSDYTNFKEFYKIMTNKNSEKIVLKKQ